MKHTHVGSNPSKFAELSSFTIEEAPKMVARFLALLVAIFGSSLLITVSPSLFLKLFSSNLLFLRVILASRRRHGEIEKGSDYLLISSFSRLATESLSKTLL